MALLFLVFVLFLICLVAGIWGILKLRNIDIWIASYVRQIPSAGGVPGSGTKKIYLCVADHHEPYFGGADAQTARKRVERWIREYRDMADRHTDSGGRHPQHTYFYPEEEYDEWIIDRIGDLCKAGYGDVEIHLHHDNDNAENLAVTLDRFKRCLFDKHGLLRKDEDGEIVYGFIHGNWALDNSRPDGRWCGVDNELEVLMNTGCLYDMTMPSAPSDTQTRTINSIYYAREDGRRKSHDKGEPVTVGGEQKRDQLMMIQGPLTLNWRSRKFGLIPRIESGELSGDAPPGADRVALWESCNVGIDGLDEHIFIKLHTHGLEAQNTEMFFDRGGFDKLFALLEERFKSREGYELHYVTAWEMYSKITELTGSRAEA